MCALTCSMLKAGSMIVGQPRGCRVSPGRGSSAVRRVEPSRNRGIRRWMDMLTRLPRYAQPRRVSVRLVTHFEAYDPELRR